MSDIVSQVVKNSKEQSTQFSQRKHSVVRVCGEEHSGSGVGTATMLLTLDNDMAYISEMKFKLVFGNPGSGSVTPYPADYTQGTNTYPSLSSWLQKYPLGAALDTDGAYGAQCWDYANAFWLAQVNRRLLTGPHHAAYECWTVNAQANAGSEFTLIRNWSDIKAGDWIVWGGGDFGHIAMAYSAPSGNNCVVWGQNQGGTPWPTGGAVLSQTTKSNDGFLGAFRYKGW